MSSDTSDVGGDGDDHTDCSPARPADVGSERRSFDTEGVRREYELTIPPGYDGTAAAPLLLSLHGFTSNIEEQDAASNFPTAAAERGYIVVTPQALEVKVPLGGTEVEAPLWNIAPAFSPAAAPGQGELEAGDDLGFLTSLLDTLEADDLCVDPDRVYVSGISNGAGMTTMLVCNDDDRFAAAAPVAGVNMTTNCSPTHPTPVIAFHGDADTLVPYEGGSLLGYDLGLPAVEGQVTDLAVVGGCDPTPVTMSALLALPDLRHRELVEQAAAARAAGGQVWPQVSPRPLRFTMSMAAPFILNLNPKFGELLAQPAEARREAYADPAWRKETLERWGEPGRFGTPRWETYDIAGSSAHPELVDRPLGDVAAQRGTQPFDTLLDLALDEPDLALGFVCTIANDDVGEVTGLLRDPHTVIGLSDAGAHVGQICDAVQATDFLGEWVRERQVMELEEAVRRLTGAQADLLGIADRGRLTPGAWADVVVFDPATVAPGPIRRVADFPTGSERLTADEPIGVRHVLVNGVPIRVDGVQDLTVRSGQLVKSVPRA